MFGGTWRADAHPTKAWKPLCNYLSVTVPPAALSAEKRIYNPGLVNFTRDYPMGTGSPPFVTDMRTYRDNPFPNDLFRVQIEARSPRDVSDDLEDVAMNLHWAELAITFNNGNSWYANRSTSGQPGVPMDYFARRVLNVVNVGSSKWKTYQADTGDWAVSLAFTPVQDSPPSPNRRQGMPAGFPAYAFTYPYDYPCPYGNNCPLWDTWGPNDLGPGVDFLANRPATCSHGANPWGVNGVDNCNIPGFPEGGGDLLDNFPLYDPDPTNYPNIPGEPIVRVNGVPAISCNIYNGDDAKPLHPLCAEFPDTDVVKVYNAFGIYAYTINPISGKAVFTHALDQRAVVDAVFYSTTRKYWTANLEFGKWPLAGTNSVGSSFDFHTRLYDTCANVATGPQAPPWPSFNPTNNELVSYVGVEDYHWDMVPTDQDAMIQVKIDKPDTWCNDGMGGATDDYCPNPLPETWNWVTEGTCSVAACECCYNECSPTVCAFNAGYNSCINTSDAGNPPGCGHEFDGNTGMAEIHNLKVSHDADNLYLKMETQGEVTFGCYGSWYPIIGCEQWNFSDQASKFTGYTWRIINQGPNGSTFYLIVLPDIPIYGEISLFLDLAALMAGGLGSNYQGCGMEAYAEGGAACSFCSEETVTPDPCEQLGCDPGSDPGGDCDGDGFVNNVDTCPCEDGGPDSQDGCTPPDPDPGGGTGLEDMMCQSCSVEKQNNRLYVQMAIEGQIESAGDAPYEILGMILGLHDLEVCKLIENACWNNFSFAALATDQAPRINYYRLGDRARKEVTLRADSVSPNPPEIKACLGRCDEAVRFFKSDGVTPDGIDDDADPAALEPVLENRVDEGYDPTSTNIEIKLDEVTYNNDPVQTFVRDLGGYKFYVARDRDLRYWHYFTMCDTAETPDCAGQSPLDPLTGLTVPRDNPALDEPYAPNGQRFPIPHDETASLTGWNWPKEPISCVMDTDCDIPGNGIDEDKDGIVDEGCYTTNCYHDPASELKQDGQTYTFRAIAYDVNGNLSEWSNSVTVTILRNTTEPSRPVERDSYALAEGAATKVVWDLNPESDIGGYALYRCPARPIDAVILEENGTIDNYCTGPGSDDHYRIVHEEILNQLKNHVKDDGMGFYEGGIGAGNLLSDGTITIPNLDTSACTTHGNLAGDDNCNAVDDDGNGVLKPGETNAYEWISCNGLTEEDYNNPNFLMCGNLDPTWAPGQPLKLYQTLDPARPVLFPTGLVDGYKYFYKVKAIDRPYAGDGKSVPGTCDNGVTPWHRDPVTKVASGCVNPIDDTDGLAPDLGGRVCDDPLIRYDWDNGGNCSLFSGNPPGLDYDGNGTREPYVIPADSKPPLAAGSLQANGSADGTSVTITWNIDTNDRTLDHFRLYRALGETGPYGCVHGGCQTAPFIDGCECTATDECNAGSTCSMPMKICTDSDLSTRPQTTGCDTAPFKDGCQCTVDDDCAKDTCVTVSGSTKACSISNIPCDTDIDCTDHRVCSYYKTVCTAGAVMTVNDGIDNDGDGLIDEDIDGNGIDDDNDGFKDEDTGTQEFVDIGGGEIKYIHMVGECPALDIDPLAPLKYTAYYPAYATATTITATDYGLSPNRIYFYKVSGVDNATYDPAWDDLIYNIHPPNVGDKSSSVAVAPKDNTAPGMPSGLCSMQYSDGLDHPGCCWDASSSKYEACVSVDTSKPPTDAVGRRLTIEWLRNVEDDIIGYNLYRASDPLGIGEPSTSKYSKVNESVIPQASSGDTLYYKDNGLDNGVDYYYMLKAVDASGNASGYSEVAGPVKPQDSTAPSAPKWDPLYRQKNIGCDTADRPTYCNTEVATDCKVGRVTSDGSGSAVVIEWAPHRQSVCVTNSETEGDFDHYNVYRSNEAATCNLSVAPCSATNNIPCRAATDITATYFKHDENIRSGETYYYCVSGVDASGNESTPYTAKSVTPDDFVPPEKPTNLTATPLSGIRIGLGWFKNKDTDIAGYRIFRSSTGVEGSYTALALTGTGVTELDPDGTPASGDEYSVIDALSYIDASGLITDETYYYKISAVDLAFNESQKSDRAYAKTSTVDVTAPGRPENINIRNGFDYGETNTTNNLDDEPTNLGGADGYIDDKNLNAGQVELYWDRLTAQDIAKYRIYRLDPPTKANCQQDEASDPNGDCDLDLEPNAVDSCDNVPNDATTNQFRTAYVMVAEKDAEQVCNTTDAHVRPSGKISANSCVLKDSGLCKKAQYWYQIVGVDSTGNQTSLDAYYAYPAYSKDKVDNTPPFMETNPAATPPPPKPKIEVVTGGGALLIKFKPLNITHPDDDNNDIMGYMLYRDTKALGTYTNKIYTINDMAQANHCDLADPDYICVYDYSVVNGTPYFYKYQAFDFNGNISALSNFAKGTPSITQPPLDANGLWAQPDSTNNYGLKISWYPGANLQKICTEPAGTATPQTTGCVSKPYSDGCACVTNDDCKKDTCSSGTCTLSGKTCTTTANCGVDHVCGYYVTDNTGLVAGYKLFRSSAESGVWNLISPPNANTLGLFPPTTTNYTDNGLIMGEQYCYKLVTVDNAGAESAGTITDPCAIPGQDLIAPGPPVGLTALPGNASVSLRWSANPETDLTGYNVYKVTYGTDLSGNPTVTYERVNSSRITYPSFTVYGLINGTTYRFAIKAYDDVGNESYPSNTVVGVPSLSAGTATSLGRSVLRGWNLIGLPSDTGGAQTSLSRIGGASMAGKKAYVVGQNGEYTDLPLDGNISAVPGMALWYYVEDADDSLFIEGRLFAGSEMTLQLKQGWNLVGNPFLLPLVWSDDHVKFTADGLGFITLNEAVSNGVLLFAAVYEGDPNTDGAYRAIVPDGSTAIPAGGGFWIKLDRPVTIKLIR